MLRAQWENGNHTIIIIIIRNSYIAPNPTRLTQSTSQFKTRMDIRIKTRNTRRSNVNSKAQANMHTSRNNKCNPDMQCSNTWTTETSHDCKSNAKNIIIIIAEQRCSDGDTCVRACVRVCAPARACVCVCVRVWRGGVRVSRGVETSISGRPQRPEVTARNPV